MQRLGTDALTITAASWGRTAWRRGPFLLRALAAEASQWITAQRDRDNVSEYRECRREGNGTFRQVSAAAQGDVPEQDVDDQAHHLGGQPAFGKGVFSLFKARDKYQSLVIYCAGASTRSSVLRWMFRRSSAPECPRT